MQIDNPMNVLTQDMARQFLNHSTPKDKYKFFLQGTQLENLNRDYQQIEQSLEVMNAKAEVKEADLGVLRRQMEELEKKARRAQHLESLRAKEVIIAGQAAWAHVEEKERDMTTLLNVNSLSHRNHTVNFSTNESVHLYPSLAYGFPHP